MNKSVGVSLRQTRFTVRFVQLVGITAIIIMISNTALQIWQDYNHELESSIEQRSTLANIADAQLSARLDALDALLKIIIRDFLLLGSIDHPKLLMDLKGYRSFLPGIREPFLIDNRGRIRTINLGDLSGADVSRRDYFLAHQGGEIGLYLSPPFYGFTKEVIIMATKAIRDDRGRLLGMAAVSLTPEFLIDAMGSIPPDRDGQAILLGSDGIIRLGLPVTGKRSGKSLKGTPATEAHLASGKRMTHNRIISVFDKEERFVTYRTLGFSDSLYVIITQKVSAVFEKWQNQSIVKGAVALASASLLFVLILISIRTLHKMRMTEEDQIKSQALYHDLVDTSQDLIWQCDAEGRYTYLNPAWEAALGYKAEEMLGRNFLDFMGAETSGEYMKEFQRILNGGMIKGLETVHVGKNGRELFLVFNAKIITDESGKVSGARGTAYDITERKLGEEKNKNLLREKELLLKEVHHRIKNNMISIMSLISMQMMTLKEPEAVNALNDANYRVQAMMLLYDKLYRSDDFTELSVEEYLTLLVTQIIRNFPNNSKVKTEMHIENFILDARRLSPLGIIINEILTNAMKYAFSGRESGLITVSATLRGKHAVFVITDDGVGMPESVDIGNSPGFGLQLVELLAQQMDGSIRVETGSGSTFILEFDV